MFARRVRRRNGQGLVEYSLTLALVAIVVVVALFAVGLVLTRIFGVTAAGLGSAQDSTSGDLIAITSSQCYVGPDINGDDVTAVRIEGTTSLGIDGSWMDEGGTIHDRYPLRARIDNLDGKDFQGREAAVIANDNGPGWMWSYYVSQTEANAGLCPKGAAIQSNSGSTAFAPIVVFIDN